MPCPLFADLRSYEFSCGYSSSSAHPRSGEPLGVRRKKKSTQRIEDEETPKSPTVEKTNVGFQLLTKMGYTEGKGLGKNLDGLPSAIVPEVKKHRGGVGLEEATQEKAEALIQRTKLEEEEIKKSFIKRTQGFFDTKQNFTDLCNLANAVLQLDERKGLTPRSEINLIYRLQSETEEMGNELLELKDDAEWIQATLRELNIHARTEHHYCSFCGVAYRSTDEINRDCPGEFREDH
uniref:G-patch domain-containing protein n=1 Tax=Rhodosorus marinus TaxID=101924 RepID=A0A7S2ZYX7_9RHOD|mmetsp:Transcript_38228/g.151338  ORF Transcript_38228/g.151338 Transcript_38228/m.151338 type:complete len:235 (+) Transcript_38228:278-982(+)